MSEFLNNHMAEIIDLCKKHKVKYFYAYGSVTSDHFSETSDLDLIVAFLPEVPVEEYGEYYFALLFSLEKITGREIDLMTQKEIRNPFLRESIEKSKTLLYAA